MHRILERQIKKFIVPGGPFPGGWEAFLNAISDTYSHFDQDRTLIERSLDLSSKELIEKNHKILAAQAVLQKAQKLAHLGTWEWDISADKFTLSDEIKEIIGHPQADGESTFDFLLKSIDPSDQTKVSEAFTKALAEKKSLSYEARIVRADGTKRNIAVQGELVIGPNDQVIKVIGTTLDITETKRREEELRESQESMTSHQNELERLNNLMIGRELKMIQLKTEIAQLKKQLEEKK